MNTENVDDEEVAWSPDLDRITAGLGPGWAWQVREQGGLVTRDQCLTSGMSAKAVDRRVGSGSWRVVHRGVYLLPGTRHGPDVRANAAFLAVQSTSRAADAAFVGASAAHLWGLVPHRPPVVQLGIPAHRRVKAPEGIRVRRVSAFEAVVHEVAFPWRTTVPVTALDAAAQGSPDHAVAVLAAAVRLGLASTTQLAAELARRRGHPHGPLLRDVLPLVEDGAQSPAEVHYVRDVERAHSLPPARRQQPGSHGPARLHDNVYEEFGIVVEVDGRLGHAPWADRVRDGRRDRSAAADGAWTSRVFWPDVAVTPCRTAVDIGRLLARRGWRGRPRPCRRPGCAVRSAT